MKLTELAKEIELTEEEMNNEVIERAFPINAYFQERLWVCGTEEEFDELPNVSPHNHFQGIGYYDEKGLLYGSDDEVVMSCLSIEDGEIISASYYLHNFRGKTAGDSIEDDVEGVVQLWIDTFEF